MGVSDWCMLGVTVLLLLADIILSQVCGSLITLVDGFHTFFILMCMVLTLGQKKVDNSPGIESLAPTSATSSSLYPAADSTSNIVVSNSVSLDPEHHTDAQSEVTCHNSTSSPYITPPCGLYYPHNRIQAVGTFLSALFLLSFCFASFIDIISFIVELHRVHHPLLLVIVGSVSLSHNLVVLVLNWDQIRARSHRESEVYIEVNHEALTEEAKQVHKESDRVLDDLGQVDDSLYNGALVLGNLTAIAQADAEDRGHRAEEQKNQGGEEPQEVNQVHVCNGASQMSDVTQTSEATSCPGELETRTSCTNSSKKRVCLAALVLAIPSLLTSLLALTNSLVMLVFDPHCHQSSCDLLAYLDPSVSLLAVITLVLSVKSQVHRYGLILLQATPPHICASELENRIAKVDGVQEVHELHIWELTESLTVASVHVKCHDWFQAHRCSDLLSEVTKVLKSVGVTCCTVQPEFAETDAASSVDHKEETPTSPCGLDCKPTCS